MKEQIEYLITFHTQAKEEVYNLLNEIDKASDKDILEEDRMFKIRLGEVAEHKTSLELQMFKLR